mgnify:CR=1 FL=1
MTSATREVDMADPLNKPGAKRSRKPRQDTSFAPRPLTPSEIEWLKREGREFQEQYSQIKADLDEAQHEGEASTAGAGSATNRRP